MNRPGIVIAIDGPAGAGKSTVARMLAERLSFDFLDTGALYRCVTLAVLRAGIDPGCEDAVAQLARALTIELDGSRVRLNGEDVSLEIRTPPVAAAIGVVADNLAVRNLLTQWQRDWTTGRDVVTEGRDQGSEVFPHAACKFFLVASSDERARRRMLELKERGIAADYQTVLEQQSQRDHEDYCRPVGGLRQADDAVQFSTDGLSLAAVVERLHSLVVERLESDAVAKPPPRSHESTAPPTHLNSGNARERCP